MIANNSMKSTSFFFLFSLFLFTACEKSSPEEILWWHNADVIELDASDFELSTPIFHSLHTFIGIFNSTIQ